MSPTSPLKYMMQGKILPLPFKTLGSLLWLCQSLLGNSKSYTDFKSPKLLSALHFEFVVPRCCQSFHLYFKLYLLHFGACCREKVLTGKGCGQLFLSLPASSFSFHYPRFLTILGKSSRKGGEGLGTRTYLTNQKLRDNTYKWQKNQYPDTFF